MEGRKNKWSCLLILLRDTIDRLFTNISVHKQKTTPSGVAF